MFTELRIRNFRLFEDLTIKGLRRINLFVGKTNSGKSAAVEAVALVAVPHGGLQLQLNLTRGMRAPTNEYLFEGHLRSFFRDLDASKKMEVTAKHSEFGIRKYKASIVQSPDASVLADRSTTESIGKLPSLVALSVRLEEHGRYLQYQMSLDNERLVLAKHKESKPPPHPLSLEYVPADLKLGEPVFDRLSELREEKRTKVILDVLRRIEPKLTDLPVVLTKHGVSNLYCDIGISKLVPLGLMGQGLARVLRLVLMMESGRQGDITVIDEIENGLYHESQFDVWRALSEAAHRYDKQVFATTHSYECIRSASDAIDRNDLAIHRLEVDDDRTTRCVTLGPEAVEGAISNGFEIR